MSLFSTVQLYCWSVFPWKQCVIRKGIPRICKVGGADSPAADVLPRRLFGHRGLAFSLTLYYSLDCQLQFCFLAHIDVSDAVCISIDRATIYESRIQTPFQGYETMTVYVWDMYRVLQTTPARAKGVAWLVKVLDHQLFYPRLVRRPD